MTEKHLSSYRQRYYSQHGEEGIIIEALRRLTIQTGYFVEFGAVDGIRNSNCYIFHANYGWSGCYIEGDRDRFALLEKTIESDRVKKLNVYVTTSGENQLDSILARIAAPGDFDLLSIDIDSDDYAVWASVERYRPKLVIIEYNRTIPNSCRYVQPLGHSKGNSARSIFELGKSKSYVAFAATADNILFIAGAYFSRLGISIPSLDDLREDTGCIFHSYDGEIVCIGGMGRNPWQHTPVIQPLPKLFRYYRRKGVVKEGVKVGWVLLLMFFTCGARDATALLKDYARRVSRRLGEHSKTVRAPRNQRQADRPP